MDKARLFAMICITLVAVSCSKSVPTDGFKDLKFGMTLTQLQALGFNCEANDIMCSRSRTGNEAPYTLFGKEAQVYLKTEAGRLTSVDVNIDATSAELIALYSKELGKPKSFTYAAFGGQSAKTYWASGSQAAVVISPGSVNLFGTPRAGATYLGPEETEALLQLASTNTTRSTDY